MAKQLMEKQNNTPILTMPNKRLWLTAPWKAYRIYKKKKAAMALYGLWEDKDTSFFDKR